ncbi:MAG: cobyrinate a,c-diamide synthase [Paracoccaceae bacterium]|nr:MAG: cobyrinate a,c-diamide synthase [Paracoccaceae bacterium]
MAPPPGLIVSAPASGTGKTTVTLGLLAAFRATGLRVQPFKCGPDYIDPAFHAAAAGVASFNLDSWAMPRADIAARIAIAAGDLILAEGAMGLFDGVATPGAGGTGASADIAALTGWPVVLVIDGSGQAQSAGAVAAGFAGFRAGVQVAGVILNRVASARHEAMLREGIARAGLPVLGALPRRPDLSLPERHLGLVQAGETADLAARLTALGEFIATHCDLPAIRAAAHRYPASGQPHRLPPPADRIAIARDAAFSFAYPHLLADWHAQGATVLPFAPLDDQPPDDSAGACWLPGGYPELHAGRLASAGAFHAALRRFAETRPVHGECGGYMAMGAALIDAEGRPHAMTGLLGLVTSYAKRRMHLGYRRAELVAPLAALRPGTVLTGHEFHYSSIIEQPDPPLARVSDATGNTVVETGSRRGLATGTFFHLIGPAQP